MGEVGRGLPDYQFWGIYMAVGHGCKVRAKIRRADVSLKTEERELAQE